MADTAEGRAAEEVWQPIFFAYSRRVEDREVGCKPGGNAGLPRPEAVPLGVFCRQFSFPVRRQEFLAEQSGRRCFHAAAAESTATQYGPRTPAATAADVR